MSQNFATILNEIRANNNKLNIVVVGNVESGKSVVEDTLCEQLGDKVERQPDERIYRHGRPQLLYIADALVSVLTASRKPQEKSVRIGKQSLDSV